MELMPFSYHLLTCLFPGGPESLCDVRGQCTATNRGRFPVLCDLHTLKLVHPDLDPALHPPHRADCPMPAIGGKEWYVKLGREFHL